MLQPLQGKRKRGDAIRTDHNNTGAVTKKIKMETIQVKAEQTIQPMAAQIGQPKAEQIDQPKAEQGPDKGGGHVTKKKRLQISKATRDRRRELLFKQASSIVRLDNKFLNAQNARAQAAGSLYERVYLSHLGLGYVSRSLLTFLYRIHLRTFTNIGNGKSAMQIRKG